MNLIQRFLIFLFGLLILVLILRCMRQSVTFTAEKFSESNEVLENPLSRLLSHHRVYFK